MTAPAWSRFRNAAVIDRILLHARANRQIWADAEVEVVSLVDRSLWHQVWCEAWMGINKMEDSGMAKYAMHRAQARAQFHTPVDKAIMALIVWPDSAHWLNKGLKKMRAQAVLGRPDAVMMLAAAIALKQETQ
jgi:hypothetical protein